MINFRYVLFRHSFMSILFLLGVISLVAWLICFILGFCGFLWGILPISIMIISFACFTDRRFAPKIPFNDTNSKTKKKPGITSDRKKREVENSLPYPKNSKGHLDTKKKQQKKSRNNIRQGEEEVGLLSFLPNTLDFDGNDVFSSVFAPTEVKRKSQLLVQVFLHLFEETEKVRSFAQEADKNAERRSYIPLQCKLKEGDKVDVTLEVKGETLLMSDTKSVVWQGSFTKCSFDYFVPKDIEVDELCCVALLTVNKIPVGEMSFVTNIVNEPRKLNTEIIAHKYNKVFVSYSHQDESKVKFLHEGLELGGVPHFFDRDYLKAGDIFPEEIQKYIDSADLFVLCWSENASKSEYVKKERIQALRRAYPKVPVHDAKISIYPISIEPYAELPRGMKKYYHFRRI